MFEEYQAVVANAVSEGYRADVMSPVSEGTKLTYSIEVSVQEI